MEITPSELGISLSIKLAVDRLGFAVSEVRELNDFNNPALLNLIDTIENKYYRLLTLPLKEGKRGKVSGAIGIINHLKKIPYKTRFYPFSITFHKQKVMPLIKKLNEVTEEFAPEMTIGTGKKFNPYTFYQMLVMMEQEWQNTLMRDAWCNSLEAVFNQFVPLFLKQKASPKLLNYATKKVNKAMPLLSEIRSGSGVKVQEKIRELKGLYGDLVNLLYNLGVIETETLEKIYTGEELKSQKPMDALAEKKAKKLSTLLDFLKENQHESNITGIEKKKLRKELGWEDLNDSTFHNYLFFLKKEGLINFTQSGDKTFYYITKKGKKYKRLPYFVKYLV